MPRPATGQESATHANGHDSVLVVGAGPVGLASALALRAQGLPVTVLEAGPEGRPRPGSRAIYVHRETLEHLEAVQTGLGREIAAHGLVWHTKRTFWGEREVFTRTYPPPRSGPLPPFASLAQAETEGLLLEACKASGADLVWEASVSGVDATPGGVTVTTESGATWSAGYLVGADGARSAVRAALGIAMEGHRSESAFVIVDVEEDPDDPRPLERIFHYAHPAADGRNVLLVPFTGGWRVDLQCRPDDDAESFNAPDGVRRWVGRVLPERYVERIRWVSTYRFLQVVAEELTDQHRRVLLVGEAAHLFAPFGARGMNSGVVDATAAAAAIRTALGEPDARAARAAIEEFGRVRGHAARHNRAAASAALAHMQARDLTMRVKRRVAAAAAVYGQRAGHWLDSAPYGPRSGPRGQASGRY
ncbi:MAG: FAD-dependent monooxygenase [Acidimicrobiales bacterium]